VLSAVLFLQSKEPSTGRFVTVDKTEYTPGDFSPVYRRTIIVPRPLQV
jgi:hypothetical protein